GQPYLTSRPMTKFSPQWLMELAADPSPRGRLLLANSVSEMLETGGAIEQELIADILMHIVRRAELDVRRTLAERLARQKKAPRELMVFLANDEIIVARPVLVLSEVLEDEDLINILHQKDTHYRKSIAKRAELSHIVVKALVMTNDEDAMQVLLENSEIALEESALRMLMQAAKRNENLKKPIVARSEMRSDLVLNIYWWVSQELRQAIQARFALNRALIDEALEETLEEILETRTSGLEKITPEIRYVAQQLNIARRITSGLLITVLRRGQTNLFIALFSEVLQLPVDKVNAMLSHQSGEFLAVCCRANNILKPDFASIFLLGRAGRTPERVVDPQELSRTLRFYDQMNYSHAMMLLEKWQRDDASLNLTHPDISTAMTLLAR
ncbi:MAG TPA: DUF2336 domain-containing protein, partial [Alphaproteobacteria bacterium]|nr:DUF2336 domain-containing protein [Alphaproteobacteria bacterium]